MKINGIKKLVIITLWAVSSAAFAATVEQYPGKVLAQADATMHVDMIAKISQLQDIMMTSNNMNTPALIEACIYTNAPSGQYRITWRSENGGAGTDFHMKHAIQNHHLNYAIKDASGAVLRYNVAQGPYSKTTDTIDCSGPSDRKSQFWASLTSDVKTAPGSIPEGEYISDLTIQVDAI